MPKRKKKPAPPPAPAPPPPLADNGDVKKDFYRGKLLKLAPRAIKLLKMAVTSKEVAPCQVRAAELILRGSRVVEDGRVLDELNRIRSKNTGKNRTLKVRFSNPKIADTDGE